MLTELHFMNFAVLKAPGYGSTSVSDPVAVKHITNSFRLTKSKYTVNHYPENNIQYYTPSL